MFTASRLDMRYRLSIFVACMMLALPALAAAPQKKLAPEAQAFVQEMVERHGFVRASLERALRGARFVDSIIIAMDAPSTSLPWHEFRARHVTEARIGNGLKFWAEHAAMLEKAAAEFKVPAEIMVATMGIETRYGRYTGSIRVLDALNTLAFGYPPRAAFFRGELEQFLLLARETGLPLESLRGSYAGAIGIPQFIPSSYRKYAVDFDGDGKVDLRRFADAIGSVANYYRRFGWQPGAPVIVPVDVGETPLDAMLAAGIKPQITVAEFRKRGVLPLEPVADDAQAALIAVESETGPRYFLGLNNFYVITRYNRSTNYAMVVHETAVALRERRSRAP